MRKLEKSEIYGIISSAVFGVLVILLLLMFSLGYRSSSDESEGMGVIFGDTWDAHGLFEPAPMSVLESVIPSSSSSEEFFSSSISEEPLLTQTFQEAWEVAKVRQQEKERRREELLRRQQEEQRRLEAERIAEQRRVEAEERARRASEIQARAQGAFSGRGTEEGGTGQGSGTSAGSQGSPFGDGSSMSGTGTGRGSGSGSSFRVDGGRGLVGRLPEPTDNMQVEGTVIVDIIVDEMGNVVDANINPGTTIPERTVRNAALAAARKTRFTGGDRREAGMITYRFTLQ